MVLQRFKIPEVMWIWFWSDIPEHQKHSFLQMSVAWSHGVKLLSACILTQKTLGRAEGRGMKAGRGWSLFKLAWLLKTMLCNSTLISVQLHRYSHTLLYGEPYVQMCTNTALHPKLECLDFLYKGSIGTAVPAVVTWDLVCTAACFGLEHSLLCVIWELRVSGTTVLYKNLEVRLSG